MKKSKHLNINKQFMVGNGILAFAVIFITVLFVYMSLRTQSKQENSFEGIYEITLVEGFGKEPIELHLNDSVIFEGAIPTEPYTLSIKQFAEQGALIFVDTQTHDISIFNFSVKGGPYNFKQVGEKTHLIIE